MHFMRLNSEGGPMIRLARREDIPRLCEIHAHALPDDLLPRLGRGFLRQVFYAQLFEGERGFAILSEEQGIRSFAVFTRNARALTEALASRKLCILGALATRVWFSPGLPFQLLAATQECRVESRIPAADLEKLPELYVMATDPPSQGRGFGTQVVREGLSVLYKDPAVPGCLVRTSSDRARSFYRRLGFEDVGSEQRGKRRLHLLLHRRQG
jgi:ribosomal protein S18 acetylase RimI-like enzyme